MADKGVGSKRLKQEILNAWWNRRYLAGREAELTYDYLGLALAACGDYLSIGWDSYPVLMKDISDFKLLSVCRVNLDEGRLSFRGMRLLWQDPALIPSLWFSEFSFFDADASGSGRLHWGFVLYPKSALDILDEQFPEREISTTGGLARQLKSFELSKDDENEVRSALGRKDLFDPKPENWKGAGGNQETTINYIELKEGARLEGKWGETLYKTREYLHSPAADEDFEFLKNNVKREDVVKQSEPQNYGRGHVFSHTRRDWSPGRSLGGRLSGLFSGRTPEPVPLHGTLHFVRMGDQDD
jgi:hypothetical protein